MNRTRRRRTVSDDTGVSGMNRARDGRAVSRDTRIPGASEHGGVDSGGTGWRRSGGMRWIGRGGWRDRVLARMGDGTCQRQATLPGTTAGRSVASRRCCGPARGRIAVTRMCGR